MDTERLLSNCLAPHAGIEHLEKKQDRSEGETQHEIFAPDHVDILAEAFSFRNDAQG
jgi:hypothetical protein